MPAPRTTLPRGAGTPGDQLGGLLGRLVERECGEHLVVLPLRNVDGGHAAAWGAGLSGTAAVEGAADAERDSCLIGGIGTECGGPTAVVAAVRVFAVLLDGRRVVVVLLEKKARIHVPAACR